MLYPILANAILSAQLHLPAGPPSVSSEERRMHVHVSPIRRWWLGVFANKRWKMGTAVAALDQYIVTPSSSAAQLAKSKSDYLTAFVVCVHTSLALPPKM